MVTALGGLGIPVRSKSALNRLAYGMAQDLKDTAITSVAVSPSFMRTEIVLATFGATEETWQQFPRLAQTWRIKSPVD